MKNNDYNVNDESNLTSDSGDRNSFGLPADYFESFEEKLRIKIAQQDESLEFPLLFSIPKTDTFIMPVDYFEGIAERVRKKNYSSQETKAPFLKALIDFIFVKNIRVAFGIVLVFSLSFFLYWSHEEPLEIGNCKTLACLETHEILSNTQIISNFDDDQLMELVDVNTLDDHLNSKAEIHTSTEAINTDSIRDDDILNALL
jgi:hypothetical protein